MKPQDRKTFTTCLLATAELLKRDSPLTETAIEVYWAALKDVDIEDFKAALSRHMRDPERGRFFPIPADIFHALAGNPGDQALRAWSKLEKAIDRYWPYESVAFDDPLIHAVVSDMGGWLSLGERDLREWPFVQKEFERRYTGYVANPPRNYPPKLVGRHERMNLPGGYEIAPPQLVGDVEQARLVLTNGNGRPKELTAAEAKESLETIRDKVYELKEEDE